VRTGIGVPHSFVGYYFATNLLSLPQVLMVFYADFSNLNTTQKTKNEKMGIKIKRVKAILRWLCGIWALGLGFRIAYSLCIYDYFIIFSHPVNIFFDFVPLAVFGAVITVIETKKLCEIIMNNNKQTRILKNPLLEEDS